jgi:hypothetical protein|tara:strand:- start:56 stop:415 length:360 start_codon:yes stop_codon:yes gene_type:complete
MNIREKLNLSPQEQRIVDYHDKSISSGKVGRDEFDRPVTVLSTGIKIPAGEKYEGAFVSVPGFVKGRTDLNEDELYKHWKKEINLGRWPMYNSGEELNKRSQDIHRIMDAEEEAARNAR